MAFLALQHILPTFSCFQVVGLLHSLKLSRPHFVLALGEVKGFDLSGPNTILTCPRGSHAPQPLQKFAQTKRPGLDVYDARSG